MDALTAVRAAARESLGLAYVPRVSELAGRDTRPELLELARAGRLELRPESGLARLSPAERAACLTGPSGVLCSYVRPL